MKALIVVDMQNDFIDGTLGTNEAQVIVPIVTRIVDTGKYDKLFFTRDTHDENYFNTLEGKKLPVKHCIKDSHGWQITDKLNIDDATIIDKQTFGYDGWSGLLDNYDEIDIVGLCTDICVISNALTIRAFYPNKQISIIESATAGTTPENKAAALKVAKSCQIDVI